MYLALVGLQKRFRAWVVWCNGRGEWSATRPPRSASPSPGSYLLWVYADSPEGLVTRMREEDER